MLAAAPFQWAVVENAVASATPSPIRHRDDAGASHKELNRLLRFSEQMNLRDGDWCHGHQYRDTLLMEHNLTKLSTNVLGREAPRDATMVSTASLNVKVDDESSTKTKPQRSRTP
jgi:hypothetical protein